MEKLNYTKKVPYPCINIKPKAGYLASYAKRQKNMKHVQSLTNHSPIKLLIGQSPTKIQINKIEQFNSPQGKILDISSIKGETTNLSIDSSLFEYKNIFNEKLRSKALSKIPSARPGNRFLASPTLIERKYSKTKSNPTLWCKNFKAV